MSENTKKTILNSWL